VPEPALSPVRAHSAPALAPPDADAGRFPGLAAMPDTEGSSAAADAAMFTVAAYGAQALLFVAGLIQKGILGPVGTGFWSLMQTFWVLLTMAPLGTMHGSTRQIPARRGRGDLAGAGAVAATGSSFSVAAVAVAGVAVALVAAVVGDGWAPELRYGLILLGLTGPLRLLSDCHLVIFQASKRFRIASLTTLVDALIMMTAGTVLVWLLGFYGMFAAVVTSCVGLLLLWTRMGLTGWHRPAFVWRIERPLVRDLLAFGAPIMIQGQIWLLFLTVDNLIVAAILGVRDLGYYALAVSITTYILLLPKSIGAALFPRMTERFAQTEDASSISMYATEVQRLLAYVLVPALVGGAYFGVPAVIRHALPDFTPAIPAVRILAAGASFLALTNMPIKVLIAAGHRWRLASLLLGCLVFNALANWVVVGMLDGGVTGAALATSSSYLVAFAALTAYAVRQTRTHDALAHVGELTLVTAYVIGSLWAIEGLVGEGRGSVWLEAGVCAAKLAVLSAVLAPVLALAELHHRVFSTAWGRMRGRRTAEA
jgi:O-antigen/teichoic acid export membrane protein